MVDFFSIFEMSKKTVESTEAFKDAVGETRLESIKPLDTVRYDAVETEPFMETYMQDDIGLHAQTAGFSNPSYIDEIRAEQPKVEIVLSRQEDLLKNNPTDLTYQRAEQTLEQYKGTIFEYQLKDALGDKFQSVEVNQQLVETEWGATKPDVVLRSSLEDIKIGDLDIMKGEDLSIEAKCGSPEYIRSEMGHMLRQVEGHHGNSLVVVTKDYLDLSPHIRSNFEHMLADKGSHIYVADVKSTDMSTGLFSSLKL